MSDVLFDYIVTAVELIASYGYSLADQYHYNEDKGVWLYQNKQEELPVSLFDNEPFKYKNDDQAESLSLAMKKAQAVFSSSVSDSLVRAAYTAIWEWVDCSEKSIANAHINPQRQIDVLPKEYHR